MIRMNLNVHNPWFKDNFKVLTSFSKMLTEHKVFEVETYRYSKDLLCLHLDTTCTGEDHAGPEIELGLFGYHIRISVHDTRHWNWTKNRWVNYEDQDELEELYPGIYR